MRLIDSSAIVKFFSEEPGWEKVKEYLYTPLSLELSMMELGSALLKKVRKNEFDESKVADILSRYPSVFRFIDQKRYLSRAFYVAKKHNISIYDSLFLAVAMNGYELVTSDNRQAEIAKKLGIKTIQC